MKSENARTEDVTARVSTLVVEWIEIDAKEGPLSQLTRLHPRGGVD